MEISGYFSIILDVSSFTCHYIDIVMRMVCAYTAHFLWMYCVYHAHDIRMICAFLLLRTRRTLFPWCLEGELRNFVNGVPAQSMCTKCASTIYDGIVCIWCAWYALFMRMVRNVRMRCAANAQFMCVVCATTLIFEDFHRAYVVCVSYAQFVCRICADMSKHWGSV